MSDVTTKPTNAAKKTGRDKTAPGASGTTARRAGVDIRKLTVTAMLSAVGFILMYLEISVPFVPPFLKLDFSELPALIGAFSMGPVSGIVICLVKNVLHLLVSSSGGIGEVSNFILGVCFVLPAGLIYKKWKTKKGAFIGALAGDLLMAVVCVFSNYFIVYPIYYQIMAPQETILAMYQAILPGMENILQSIIVFNAPFTFIKGLFSVIIAMLIYKPLSPIIKGSI